MVRFSHVLDYIKRMVRVLICCSLTKESIVAASLVVCSFTIAGLLVNPLITNKMDDPSAPPSRLDINFTQGILIIAIITTVLSATVAGLRFATRAWIVKGLGWDDYAMMMAIVNSSN